jgi:hypothetical protein
MSSSKDYPQLVMIIRHGEKAGDPSVDKGGGPDLSILGSARAAALPSLFTPDPTASSKVQNLQQLSCDVTAGQSNQFAGTYGATTIPAGNSRFPVPDFLFATQASNSSNRPVETITPLSQALAGLKINSQFPDASYKELAKEILGNPQTYGGQVILICWHHGKAPKLAKHLGVSQKQLDPWDPWNPKVFDLVFHITWDSSGTANLKVHYQQLLFGDTKKGS